MPNRSFSGCWTCRLRRKKCDERHPVCHICSVLQITCHYDSQKPPWMDGGDRQAKMAEFIRNEVKEQARKRREGLSDQAMASSVSSTATNNDLPNMVSAEQHSEGLPCLSKEQMQTEGLPCLPGGKTSFENLSSADTILITFYIDQIFPNLFPFYQPSLQEGGKSWLLELLLRSPVLRKATLCQSSYFLQHKLDGSTRSTSTLFQIEEAFTLLRKALQIINDSSVREHLHGSVRVLAGIVQLQRFAAVHMIDTSWRIHLRAATSLARQILDCYNGLDVRSRFEALISDVGPSTTISGHQFPSAEQSVLGFSFTSLVINDIIASIVLRERIALQEYHAGLLSGDAALVNLQTVYGCKNWVFLQLAEVAILESWKREQTKMNNLDITVLVQRATIIKDELTSELMNFECSNVNIDLSPSTGAFVNTNKDTVMTRIWANAVLLYLSLVVSGPQIANNEVRQRVRTIITLLATITTNQFLQSMVWPFFVAGCLAGPELHPMINGLVKHDSCSELAKPLGKALEVLNTVWNERTQNRSGWTELAELLDGHDLVLLV